MAPRRDPREVLLCEEHGVCAAEIEHLKEQQAATWKRMDQNAKDYKGELEKLQQPLRNAEVSVAKYAEAFAALRKEVGQLSHRIEAKVNDLSVRIDALVQLRHGDNTSNNDWTKVFVLVVSMCTFMYILLRMTRGDG